MKNIVFIYRAKKLGKSIEEVFNNIYVSLISESNFKFSKFHLKYNNKWYNILFNIFSFKTKSNTIYHITGDIHYMIVKLIFFKTIITIHDVGSILKGNYIKRKIKYLFWFYIPLIFTKKITVVSEFTKNELIKISKFYVNKIIVIYNPLNPIYIFSPKKFNKTYPIILHIGTNTNKNLLRVVDAIKFMSVKLIVVGSLNEIQKTYIEKNDIDFENFVNISNLELYELYKMSDIVSFPSTYEGFGLPIIEANSIGRVVITSNICSMPEIANNAACFVDPYDVFSIKNAISKVINDDDFRDMLIQNGIINSNRFLINKISKDYINLYNQI